MQKYYSDKNNKSSAYTIDTYTSSNQSTFGASIGIKELFVGNQNIYQVKQSQFKENQVDTPNPFHHRTRINPRQRYNFHILGSQQTQNTPSLKCQHSNNILISLKIVFVYDWDDTLICTTYLARKNFANLTQQCRKYLKQIDLMVQKILKYSIQKGFVFLITNSAKGWINYSSKLYLTNTHKIIKENKQRVEIWSARELYAEKYPDDVKMWKMETFKKLKGYLNTNILTNLICVGDGEEEMEACNVVSEYYEKNKIFIKKIKFDQKPTPEELIKQLKLLQKKFQQIFYAIASTTIKLMKRVLTPQRKKSNDSEDFEREIHGNNLSSERLQVPQSYTKRSSYRKKSQNSKASKSKQKPDN